MEIWKDIEGYEGLYQVSNLGRIKSLPRLVQTTMNARHYTSTILSLNLNGVGYCVVNLSKNGNVKMHKVHRLVAKAFIPNDDNKPCVDHINGIRNDNRAENLRWCTIAENNTYDLAINNKILSHKDQTNTNLRKKVCQYSESGELIREYESSKEAAEAVECSRSAITKGCREVIKIKGYFWKYKKDVEN